MKYTDAFIATLAAVALAAPAKSNVDGVVSLPIARKGGLHAPVSKNKRDTTPVPIENLITQYVANIEIGTPPQEVKVTVDTGSSNTWVFLPESGVKTDNAVFNSSESSTYKSLNHDFSQTYVKGYAKGDWATDTISAGGATAKNQRFGAVSEAGDIGNSQNGVLGLGYKLQEGFLQYYDNFPASLYKQGAIKSETYSVYLNDLDASTGNILFGGYDRAKYTGDLFTVGTNIFLLQVDTSLVGYGDPAGFRAALDTGTSISYVPDDVMEDLIKEFGARLEGEYYVLDEKPTKGVTFNFSDKGNITVDASELVIKGSQANLKANYLFPFLNSTGNGGTQPSILGDSFLRSAYLLFDLYNRTVSLGQASYSSESDIVAIEY